MKTRSSTGMSPTSLPEAEHGKGLLRAQKGLRCQARTSGHRHDEDVVLLPKPAREHLLVEVLRLLSPRVRERFCYVGMAMALAVFGLSIYFAPHVAVAGSSVVAMAGVVARALRR